MFYFFMFAWLVSGTLGVFYLIKRVFSKNDGENSDKKKAIVFLVASAAFLVFGIATSITGINDASEEALTDQNEAYEKERKAVTDFHESLWENREGTILPMAELSKYTDVIDDLLLQADSEDAKQLIDAYKEACEAYETAYEAAKDITYAEDLPGELQKDLDDIKEHFVRSTLNYKTVLELTLKFLEEGDEDSITGASVASNTAQANHGRFVDSLNAVLATYGIESKYFK